MGKKNRLLVILGIAGLILVLVALPFMTSCAALTPTTPSSLTMDQGKVFKWKFQGDCPESDSQFWIYLKQTKKLIEEGSGGRVQVEIFPVDTFCSADSVVDSIAKDAFEGGAIISGMAADRAPSCLASEMPFGARDMYDHLEVHYMWGLNDIIREEYATQNLHLLSISYVGQVCFQSSFPVNTLDDLKGKKIWVNPNTAWLTKFGAVSTDVPGFDMYMALKLGTIDGFIWTMAELESSNLKEVVKYIMWPQLMTPANTVLVNLNEWDSLGPDLQRQIQDHVDAHMIDIAREMYTNNAKGIRVAEEYGVKSITLPPSDIARMQKAATDFWDEVAAGGPYAAKMIESYRAWLKYKELAW